MPAIIHCAPFNTGAGKYRYQAAAFETKKEVGKTTSFYFPAWEN
jgi:hypothetical protein